MTNEISLTECTPTKYCDDGKIEEDKCEIPEGGAPGETVTLKIVVDNTSFRPWHETKYRLKVVHEWDGSEWSDEEFVLGAIGEHTVEHEVTIPYVEPGSELEVHCVVQRCCDGRWENCPHEDAKKTFVLKVFETSDEAWGKIVKYNAPARAAEGMKVKVTVTIKNIGGKEGEFRVFLIDKDTGEELSHAPIGYWKNLDPWDEWTTTLKFEMPNRSVNLKLAVRRQHETEYDDEEEFSVELSEAHGEIVYYDPPKKVPPDTEFTIPVTIKNSGHAFGEFRVFLINAETGEELDHKPDITWKNLDPGDTWSTELKARSGRTNMKLRLEVREQETPNVPDDYEEFTVAVKKPEGKVVAVDCPTTVTPGEKFTLTATIKNVGEALGEFRIYVFDNESGEKLGKEPDTYWKNLDPGETYTADFSIRAPPEVGKWSVRVEARQQATPNTADDVALVEIEVRGFTILECLFPRLLRGDLFPRIGLEGINLFPRLTCILQSFSKNSYWEQWQKKQ